MPPSLGCSIVNFICGSMEFKYWSILSRLPLGMMPENIIYIPFQSLTGTGSSGPNARFSKYSIYMLATTGELGEPIARAVQLFKELVLEGEDRVLQDQFRELHYLILFKTYGVPSEGTSILVLGFRILNMFTEQSVDDIQGCGDWDAVKRAETSRRLTPPLH